MQSFGPRSPISALTLRALLVTVCLMAVASTLGEVVWEKSFATAIKKAVASKKPIFVDFYAEWCGPCKMLESDVFSDPRVKSLLEQAVCLRIDVDQNQADAEKFKVTGIPRLLLLSSDGKGSKWDAVGYRDADTFLEELSEAMKVKAAVMAAPTKPIPVPPALEKTRTALSNGTFGQLKAQDPASAKQGIALLVQKLGAFKEPDFKPIAALLQKAGRDAIPALIEGMGHKALAVRVGSYKVVQTILSKDELKGLSFDPWAAGSVRTSQLQAWKRLVKAG